MSPLAIFCCVACVLDVILVTAGIVFFYLYAEMLYLHRRNRLLRQELTQLERKIMHATHHLMDFTAQFILELTSLLCEIRQLRQEVKDKIIHSSHA